MPETKTQNTVPSPTKDQQEREQKINKLAADAYDGDADEARAATDMMARASKALELREQSSVVFNGIPYSQSYSYNQKKGVGYAPPKNANEDREVTMGLPHEKVVAFCAIFLKYVMKRRVKCYDEEGRIIQKMGTIYDLGIEHSYRLEQFKKLIGLIYWEVFTQGAAGVLEEWEVRTLKQRDAFNDKGEKIDGQNMDYTYEFIDNLKFRDGQTIQTRKARSRLLDGRQIIFGNPEITDVQDQPLVIIEEEFDEADAQQIFGTLKRWKAVPKTRTEILARLATDKSTLFDVSRFDDKRGKYLAHYVYDKPNNRWNIFLNGVMLFHRDTPFDLFYPRRNYPLSWIPCERLSGSIYPRSIPAKTKFNADFVDWAIKMLAMKFEQGVRPAILAKGKYTLTADIFRAGQVTHGISKGDFEKADPDNNGITRDEFSFVDMLKQIIENQTVNPTSSGEYTSDNATATEISLADANMRDKLGFLLDGIVNGFMDMALRRAETIESKYTTIQRMTIVDGKQVPVYQNFTVNVSGVENNVIFDESASSGQGDFERKNGKPSKKEYELFSKEFADKKRGIKSKYYILDPRLIRQHKYSLDIEVLPERIKDTQLQMISLFDEITKLLNLFGPEVNREELKKLYLEVSGRPGELFLPAETVKLNAQLDQTEQGQPYNMGSFGKPQPVQQGQKPRVSDAAKQAMMGKVR